MSWQTPKIDWDSADYYNFGDLNRVESNTQEIANMIGSYGYTPSLISVITDRDNTRIEFYDDLNRVESNILLLKDSTYTPTDFETPKTNWRSASDVFDYNSANRLENNLLRLYNMVNNIIDYFAYCGATTCGQDNTYL